MSNSATYETIEITYESQDSEGDTYNLHFKKDRAGSTGSFSSDMASCKVSGELSGLAPHFLDGIVNELDKQGFFFNPKVWERLDIMDGILLRRLHVKVKSGDREREQNLEILNNGVTPYDETVGKLEQYVGKYLSHSHLASFIDGYRQTT